MENGHSKGNRIAAFSFLSFISLIAVMLTGCSKDNGVCFSNSGPVKIQQRVISETYNQLDVQNNVNVIFTDSMPGTLQVECGSKLSGGITTNVQDSILYIRNNNICNWLRNYETPINVYVPKRSRINDTSSAFVRAIYYNGSGNITSQGPLNSDSIRIELSGGGGSVNISLDSVLKGDFSILNGTADIILSGNCREVYVYSASYGRFDGRDLITKWTHITTYSPNDCYVRVEKFPPNVTALLDLRIRSIGNIYYKSSYDQLVIQQDITGSGKLIKN